MPSPNKQSSIATLGANTAPAEPAAAQPILPAEIAKLNLIAIVGGFPEKEWYNVCMSFIKDSSLLEKGSLRR